MQYIVISFLKKLLVNILSGMYSKDYDLTEIPAFLHSFFDAILSEVDGLQSSGRYAILLFP